MKINFNTIKPYINTYNPQAKKGEGCRVLSNPVQSDTFEKSVISFEAKRGCSESNFKVKNIKNLRCPVCAKIMLNDKQQKEFIDKVISKRGEDLVEVLEFYEDERNITQDWSSDKKISLYRPQRQQVVDILKKIALEHPSLSLKELVAFQAQPHLKKLIQKQMEVVEELENYAHQNIESAAELLYFNSIVKKYVNRIKGCSKEQFQRKDFINELSDVTSRKKVQKRITQIAQKLPTSTNDVNSFFVKYALNNRSSKEIAQQLCINMSPTAEHLHPKTRGGKNNTANYICDCSYCNGEKGDLLFYDWAKDIPGFESRLQEYLSDIVAAIDKGEIPQSYDHYIAEIIETIRELSKNTINLKMPYELKQYENQ